MRLSASPLSEPSKADSIGAVEPRRDFLRDAWTAGCACVAWLPAPSRSAQMDARALIFLPVMGLLGGVILALCDRLLLSACGVRLASALVISLSAAISGGLFPMALARTAAALIRGKATGNIASMALRAPGIAIALVIAGAEIFVLSALTAPPARARALVLAMLLSRWSIVPIGYGLKPLEKQGLGVPYGGGITFREFGLSSVIALGAAMGLYDIVGLAAIVAVALTILCVRWLLSRRLGGAGGSGLAAGAALCELIALGAAAAMSAL